MTNAVLSAQSSLFLRAYRVTSLELIKAIGKQAQNGLNVHCIFDAFHHVELVHGPNTTMDHRPRRSRKIMHQKSLVLDGSCTWLGSPNFTDTSFNNDPNTFIVIRSQELCQFVMENSAGSFKLNNQRISFFTSIRYHQAILTEIVDCIRNAQHSIQIIMYALTCTELLQELNSAQQNGVRVTVITDPEYLPLLIQRYQEFRCKFDVFCKVGPGKQHNKICIIDNEVCLTGSMNWTRSAILLNSETLLLLRDLTQEQNHKLMDIWRRSLRQSRKIYIRDSAHSGPRDEAQPSTSTTPLPLQENLEPDC